MEAESNIVDVFLCHNGADKDWVRRLAEQLESETVDGSPNGRKIKVFFDEWDIDVGDSIILKINEGLSRARYVAVVISPEFVNAPWPALEWTHVVSTDPVNRQGRLIPLFCRDFSPKTKATADMPAPFRSLAWIDFRDRQAFRPAFAKLIRKIRGLPDPRGRQRAPLETRQEPAGMPGPDVDAADPDEVSDVVLGNLLPLESMPEFIWSAPTEARTADDVFKKVPKPLPFELQDKRLYTFADLRDASAQLRAVIGAPDVQRHPVGDWADDPVRGLWLMSLLNRCLKQRLHRLPIRQDDKGRYYFLPNRDGTSRVWRNGKDPEREVAARKSNPDTLDSFWVHHGARVRFRRLGERFCLWIDPCYVFTSDGIEPLKGPNVGPLSMQWGGKERNAAILRHVIFWARTLSIAKAKINIETGGDPLVLSGIPALARTNFGIDLDHIGIGALIAQVEDELSQAAAVVTISAAPQDAAADEDEESS